MNEFYVLGANGQPSGPHDIDALVKLVQTQQVPRDASVAAVGESQWTPLMAIPDIAKRFETPSKRPPGPPPRRSNPPPAMTPAPTPAPQPVQAAPSPAAAPSQPVALTPVPPVAATPAPIGVTLPAGAAPIAAASAPVVVAEAKSAEKKDEKKPPTLDPKYKMLPWLIFGGFAFVVLVLFIIALVRSPPKEEYGSAASVTASPRA